MDFHDIAYLEIIDFTGNTLNIKGTVICLCWGAFCHHCKVFHPTYQEFADKMKNNKNITVACIQADGTRETEKELGKQLSKIVPGFKGFPTVVKFQNGHFAGVMEGPRTVENLMNFAK